MGIACYRVAGGGRRVSPKSQIIRQALSHTNLACVKFACFLLSNASFQVMFSSSPVGSLSQLDQETSALRRSPNMERGSPDSIPWRVFNAVCGATHEILLPSRSRCAKNTTITAPGICILTVLFSCQRFRFPSRTCTKHGNNFERSDCSLWPTVQAAP